MNLLKTIAVGLIASTAIISCTTEDTIYNGYVKNNSEKSILIDISGEKLLLDTITIGPGETEKVAYSTEQGDYEIYDCASFFDSIVYNSGSSSVTISNENAEIEAESRLGSDGTRVHECTVIIR